MNRPDWPAIDRWLMGEAWTGSRARDHAVHLCDTIGPRWSGSDAEWEAIHFIRDQLTGAGLDDVQVEEFGLDTWNWSKAEARLQPGDLSLQILPFIRCPSFAVEARVVDVGFGTPRAVEEKRSQLVGSVAVMSMAYEPFTTPEPHAYRLHRLALAGAVAAVVVDAKNGGRMEYHSSHDSRDPDLPQMPLPAVATSREHGDLLRRSATSVTLEVEALFSADARTANVSACLRGTCWPDEHLLLGGHHDTVICAPGGNDNASGTIAVLETARVLAALRRDTGQSPGRAIRFVTFSAEEQGFRGSFDYVKRHYGDYGTGPRPHLAINLDELSAGHMKGLVLGFPHLRGLVQRQFDDMKDGLQCHIMSQIDGSSDHFPFLLRGIDAGHLWRWRFRGRHPDSDYHHEAADTSDKLNVRELKEYAGQLARLLLRLSWLPPEEWPENTITPQQVQQRLSAERGSVVRIY
jgi:hypothetical protein